MNLCRLIRRLLGLRRTTRPTGDPTRKAALKALTSTERACLRSHLARTNQRQHPKQ